MHVECIAIGLDTQAPARKLVGATVFLQRRDVPTVEFLLLGLSGFSALFPSSFPALQSAALLIVFANEIFVKASSTY